MTYCLPPGWYSCSYLGLSEGSTLGMVEQQMGRTLESLWIPGATIPAPGYLPAHSYMVTKICIMFRP